jgi:Spy/CpxP family protein refolding chaperone
MTASLSRTARVVLLLSLALNLGLGAWLWMHAPWDHAQGHTHGRGHPGVSQLLDLRRFRHALPPERQHVLEKPFDTHRAEMRARIGRLIDARRAVRDAIRAEPFDRDALDVAFARLREAEAATAGEAQALLGDALELATPQERQQMAELMPLRMRRDRDRDRDSRREREPRDADSRSH